MTNNWFDEFLNQYYLIALIMLVVALGGLALCISQILIQKASTLRVMFLIYFAIVLTQGLMTVIYTYLTYPYYSESVNLYSEYFYAVSEFVVFSIILHHILSSNRAKNGVRLTTAAFLLTCIFFFPPSIGYSANSYRLSIVSAFLIVGQCLVYFYELFLFEPTKKLTNEPAFWTATGILLYLVCLIPNLLVLQFVAPEDYLKYAGLAYINFFASSTLYVFFIKALLCKTPQVTSLSS